MRTNAILVRWKGGWRWVTDVSGLRIETCQGHAGDSAEVVAKTNAELDTYKAGQTQITVGIDPDANDPVPGKDYDSGDRADVDGAERDIEAFAYEVDDVTGRVTSVPQFGAILDEPEERVRRTLRNIGGLNQGTSHLARPTASIPPPNVKP